MIFLFFIKKKNCLFCCVQKEIVPFYGKWDKKRQDDGKRKHRERER